MVTDWQGQPDTVACSEGVRSQACVRSAIRRSPVPVAVWAKALGCSKRGLYRLLAGDSALLSGPLMNRARSLLDALHTGRSHWLKQSTPGRPGHPTYRLIGQQFTPAAGATMMYHVDFLHCQMTRVPTGPLRAAPLWQPETRSHAGGLIGKYFPDNVVVGPSGLPRGFPFKR